MIYIDDLVITQDGLRNIQQLEGMINYTLQDGIFDAEYLKQFPHSNPIKILIAEDDGVKYLHDGHHRTKSVWFAGRKILHPSEYVTETYSYSRFMKANPENGWFTPYDPRIHVRKADFFDFKNKAMTLIGDELEEFIENNKNMYLTPREHWKHISQLSTYFPL